MTSHKFKLGGLSGFLNNKTKPKLLVQEKTYKGTLSLQMNTKSLTKIKCNKAQIFDQCWENIGRPQSSGFWTQSVIILQHIPQRTFPFTYWHLENNCRAIFSRIKTSAGLHDIATAVWTQPGTSCSSLTQIIHLILLIKPTPWMISFGRLQYPQDILFIVITHRLSVELVPLRRYVRQ